VSDTPRLILASTSPYRRQLLDRLGLAYTVEKPEVDEAARAGESPAALSERLAYAKAAAVSARHPDAWVIGSDQVCDRDDVAIGKSGNHAAAVAQLMAASGKTLRFHTSVCLSRDTAWSVHRDVTEVAFRALDASEIERYLRSEAAYDCAGSFKCEGLGIALFERIESEDPTALIGLPLIALARMLRNAGFPLP